MATYVIRLASTGLVYDIPAGEVLVSNGDGTFSGEEIFPSVPVYGAHLCTTGALPSNTRTLNTITATGNGALTVDGSATVVGDVLLLKDEALQENNGLWIVTGTGSGSAPYVLTRATSPFVPGTLIIVLRGTSNAGTIAFLRTEGTIVPNVTGLSWQLIIGSGGGSVGGTPVPGYVITADSSGAPVWHTATPFAVTTFNGAMLYECKQSVVHPAFSASSTATPTSALLTNTDNGESLDVHLTPTSFASAQTYHKDTPNLSITWTLTESDGIYTALKTLTAVWGQFNFAGKVPPGSALSVLTGAATYKVLDTQQSFNFSITDDGTHQAQVAIPSRYGTVVCFDRETGFGVGMTLVDTTNYTNIQGYAELYDHYVLDAGINGTANFRIQS